VKIKTIAAAALAPAAVAGGLAVALSGGSPAGATAGHSAPARASHTRTVSDARADARAKSGPTAHGPARPSGNVNDWVTVKPGQTLAGIAAAHHMSWQAVYATPPNPGHLPDPNRLTAGERLRIPADPELRAAQFRTLYAAKLRAEGAAQAASQQPAARQSASHQPASQPAAAASTAGTQGGSLTAGMSPFEQCVAYRESTDTPTDPDGLFGILPSTWAQLGYSGTAGQASVAQQEVAFNRLYAEYGAQPWAPSDGC
jgi:hypothetical protein